MCSTACEASFRPLIVRDPCGADIETEIGSLSRGNTDRMWLSPGLESRMIPELLFPMSLPRSHHTWPCGQSGACPTSVNTHTCHPRAFVLFRATPCPRNTPLWPPSGTVTSRYKWKRIGKLKRRPEVSLLHFMDSKISPPPKIQPLAEQLIPVHVMGKLELK